MKPKHLLLLLLLPLAWVADQYYNYATLTDFSEIHIYWYSNDNVRLVEDGDKTILFDLDTSTQLGFYDTNSIIVRKDSFRLFKSEYGAEITFTEEYLEEINN